MLVLFYHKSGDLGSSTGFMGWRNTFDTLIKDILRKKILISLGKKRTLYLCQRRSVTT